MSNIAYSVIVLNERSKQRLIKHFKNIIPKDFQIVANHMIINQGNIDLLYEKYLGINVSLDVIDYYANEKNIVVGVNGFYSENKKPYIVLATHPNNNNNNVNNNLLFYSNDWKPIKRPLKISGTVTEIEFKF